MKWSIVGLISLGTVAAICATLMVVSFQNTARADSASEPRETVQVPVLVASGDIDIMTVISSDMIGTREVAQDLAPRMSFSDPVQVVGKLLVKPMAEGQAFTADAFASEKSGLLLATAVSEGMRAVSISTPESMALEGFLAPGSIVDVVSALKVRQDNDVEPMSVTILHGVMVLAIGDRSIMSLNEDKRNDSTIQDRHVTVTLLVSPEQAEKLKLASEEGTISLALRNPMDESIADSKGARLASLSPVFAEISRRKENARLIQRQEEEARRMAEEQKRELELQRERYEAEQAQREAEAMNQEGQAGADEVAAAADSSPAVWETLILRGGVAETKTFPESDVQGRE